jgi:hypothetical protein
MKNAVWFGLSLLLGFSIGIGYAWLIRPTDFEGAPPNSLRAEYRGEYVLLIASSFRTTGDLDRARSRLTVFPGLDAAQLASLAQQVAATGGGEQTARDLAILALALGKQSAPGTPDSQISPTALANNLIPTTSPYSTLALPLATLPLPKALTMVPSATMASQFRLQSQEKICDAANPASPQFRVYVRSADGKGVAGIDIVVRWPGGQGHMVTGLKPEIDGGYADYDIVAGVEYELALGEGALTISGLSAPGCAAVGSVGSLLIKIISQ